MEVRKAMQSRDPEPVKPGRRITTDYVVPTTKKRQALAWEVRTALHEKRPISANFKHFWIIPKSLDLDHLFSHFIFLLQKNLKQYIKGIFRSEIGIESYLQTTGSWEKWILQVEGILKYTINNLIINYFAYIIK